jgi:hypothetical protein
MSFKCRVRCGGSVQVVSERIPFAKTRVHCNSIPHAVCGGKNDTGSFLYQNFGLVLLGVFCQCSIFIDLFVTRAMQYW